jgi:uncharacterized membrane protein
MIIFLIAITLSFIVTNLFGWVVHFILHRKEAKQFNASHMAHHLKLYPPTDFFSDVYRDAGNDSTPKFFIVAAIPMLLSVAFFWWLGIISFFVACCSWSTMIGVGLLDNFLHDAFHIRNHWLNRVPLINRWYDVLVKLHFLHHCDMTRNYGIFNFMWDRILKTFWDKRDFIITDIRK